MTKGPAGRRRGTTMKLGNTKVTRLGETVYHWQDAYHFIMSLTWPRFFASAVSVYLLVNLTFATAYYAGDHAIENARSFLDCFFFSVETLATVGYGAMSPVTLYGHCVATAEIITGMMSMAVITGLVFARFSKPTARLLFSKVAVITRYEGVPTLMLRVANRRQSYILDATASVVMVREEDSTDGHNLTRFHTLKLERPHSPMFALSWQLLHRIDESSPLFGMTSVSATAADLRLVVTLSGVDDTFAASVNATYFYSHEDILFGRRFVDIFSDGEHPRHLYVDLGLFHDVAVDDEA